MGHATIRPKRCKDCNRIIAIWNKSGLCGPCWIKRYSAIVKARRLKKQEKAYLRLKNGFSRYRRSELRQFCCICDTELNPPFKSMHCINPVCAKAYLVRKGSHHRCKDSDHEKAYHKDYYLKNKAKWIRKYELSRKNNYKN